MATLPRVAIVGRPNVGKSTLFNRLTGSRIAIVEATPGVTRDRVTAHARLDGPENRVVELTDTGGIGVVDRDDLGPVVEREIQRALAASERQYRTLFERSGDAIIIPAGKPTREATLWLMAFVPSISTEIKKGENAGSTIDYYNVVRKMVPAGMWHGEAAKIVLPKSSVIPEDCKGWVALLQEGKVGRIMGAATGGTRPNA